MIPGADRDARLLRGFDELSELSADEQARRLVALALEDRDLASALRRMLGADAHADGPLESGVDSLVEALVADEGKPLLSGQRIGPFVLERPLGRGGMGEVWLAAREEAGFRQTVALKRLKRGMDSDEILRRFVQERRILAELSHPNIARFIDGGVGADGVPWYAMEYVDGTSITAHADARALDVRARVETLAQVAEAVAYAQNRLVVHRDLKPSNILVDAAGVPHLLDFGIAKLLQDGAEPQATATGVRALSPAYAAPEQILDQAISAATDVYALGVVLYELLTGELPHARSGLSLEALVDSVRHETIERPSARLRASTTLTGDPARTQQTLRAVTGELDAIVLTALRREPERRYANAAAFADDLRRWLDGRPVRAQPDTTTYRLRKFVARNRLAVGSASAVLLALIAGFGTALWQASVAREQAALAQEQTRRALHVKDFLVSLFAESEGMGRPKDAPRTPLQMIDGAIVRAERDLAVDPTLRDAVLGDLIEIKINLGAGATVGEALDQLIEYRRTQFGARDPRLADALAVKVNALFQLGRFPEAESLIEQAIGIYTQAFGADHQDVTNMQNRMVRVRVAQSQFDQALVLMREVIRKSETDLGSAHPELGMRLSNLATVLIRLQKPAEAREALERSLTILEAARGPSHPTLAFPLVTLGDLQREAGEFDEALATYRRVAEIVGTAMGREHPRYAVALNRVGDMQRRLRDFVAAEDSLGQARVIQEQGGYAELGDSYARLGNLASDRDQAASAEMWYRKAHQFQLSTQGVRSSLTWARLGLVSDALVDQGRYDEARVLRDEVTIGLQALGPGNERQVLISQFVAGLLERNAGNLDRAVELTNAAYQRLAALNSVDEKTHATLRAQLALTHALRQSEADRAIVENLVARIDARLFDSDRVTAAHYLLLQALHLPPGVGRDRARAELGDALRSIGSDGSWLRVQHSRLSARSGSG